MMSCFAYQGRILLYLLVCISIKIWLLMWCIKKYLFVKNGKKKLLLPPDMRQHTRWISILCYIINCLTSFTTFNTIPCKYYQTYIGFLSKKNLVILIGRIQLQICKYLFVLCQFQVLRIWTRGRKFNNIEVFDGTRLYSIMQGISWKFYMIISF